MEWAQFIFVDPSDYVLQKKSVFIQSVFLKFSALLNQALNILYFYGYMGRRKYAC